LEEISNIAGKYEVTGATVLNSIHHSAIHAYKDNRYIKQEDILESLKREFRKEDRMLI
jgi:hypothetical protein